LETFLGKILQAKSIEEEEFLLISLIFFCSSYSFAVAVAVTICTEITTSALLNFSIFFIF
jgi:hypothetical protein